MTQWPEVWIALISAVTGGGLLKLADIWFNRQKIRNDNAKQLRDETRIEVTELRQQIKDLDEKIKTKNDEIDNWRKQYWDVYMSYKTFQMEVSQILINNGISMKDLFKDAPS